MTDTSSAPQVLRAGPIYLPAFQQGSYSIAVARAFAENKLLLLYVHSEDHEDTAAFLQDTLLQLPETSDDVLYFTASINEMEGYRLASDLNVTQFPFLGMFVAQAANKAAVLGKLSGPVELSVLTRLLTNAVQAQAGIMTQRTSREHKNASDRIIRNQQDREYEEALLADSRLEAETSSQAVAETHGDQTSSDDEEDDAMGLEDVVGSLQRQLSEEELEQKCFQEQVLADQQEKAALLRQMAAVQAECAERVPEPSPSDDVKVLFILPNGSKVDRTFDSKTGTVASLYDFVGSQALLDTDSTPVLRYELVTTFPKTVIERKEEDSIASLKLGRRIKLHVARIVQNIE